MVEVLRDDPEASVEELAGLAEECAEAIEEALSPHHPNAALYWKRSAEALDRGGYTGAAAEAYDKAAAGLEVAYGVEHPAVQGLRAAAVEVVQRGLAALPVAERAAMVAQMSPGERARWGGVG